MRAEGRAGVSYPGEVLPALLENFAAIGHHTLNNDLIDLGLVDDFLDIS